MLGYIGAWASLFCPRPESELAAFGPISLSFVNWLSSIEWHAARLMTAAARIGLSVDLRRTVAELVRSSQRGPFRDFRRI